MKKTALHAWHVEFGAKMTHFSGYDMPLQYDSVIQEHLNVRENVGIFDVSHMGEFMVTGVESEAFLQKVTSNDVCKLKTGQAQYAYLPNDKLGIVDDLLIYKLGDCQFMLVVNASNIDKDFQWLSTYAKDYKVSLEDTSDQTALIALQGPKASLLLNRISDRETSDIPFYHFEKISVCHREIIVSATGYTGAGGFELYIPNKFALEIWNGLFSADHEGILKPAGLVARDTLRLEMGYCLYGNDIDEGTSPLEAGLGWATKLETDFIGSELIKKQKEKGLEKKRVGILMEGKGIPRKGYLVADADGGTIGKLTSGTQSPVLKKGIAMGYVSTPYTKPGTKVHILIRNQKHIGVVTKLPFVK